MKLSVVSHYKHLGAIVDGQGSYMPEALRLGKPAVGAFAPIALIVFCARKIPTQRRLNLATPPLVFSRLVYNIHTWSELTGRPCQVIRRTYGRILRRIAGDVRHGRTVLSDVQVRVALSVPSVDCYVRKRRLMYLCRVIRTDVETGRALLQQKLSDGSLLPWMQLCIIDLEILQQSLPNKLGDLPNPRCDLEAWWCLIRDYPSSWKQLVAQYVDHEGDKPKIATSDYNADGISCECVCVRVCAARAWWDFNVKNESGLLSDLTK